MRLFTCLIFLSLCLCVTDGYTQTGTTYLYGTKNICPGQSYYYGVGSGMQDQLVSTCVTASYTFYVYDGYFSDGGGSPISGGYVKSGVMSVNAVFTGSNPRIVVAGYNSGGGLACSGQSASLSYIIPLNTYASRSAATCICQ